MLPLIDESNAKWDDRFLFVHVGRWSGGKASESKYKNCSILSRQYRFVNKIKKRVEL